MNGDSGVSTCISSFCVPNNDAGESYSWEEPGMPKPKPKPTLGACDVALLRVLGELLKPTPGAIVEGAWGEPKLEAPDGNGVVEILDGLVRCGCPNISRGGLDELDMWSLPTDCRRLVSKLKAHAEAAGVLAGAGTNDLLPEPGGMLGFGGPGTMCLPSFFMGTWPEFMGARGVSEKISGCGLCSGSPDLPEWAPVWLNSETLEPA